MSKKIYPSKYTDKKVTDAQYLVDCIVERIAQKEKTSLPYKYWNDPYWNKIFRRQIGEANALLKEIDCVTIMAFLNSVKGKNIYSLGLKKSIIDGCKRNIATAKKMENVQADYIIVDEFIEDMPENEVIEKGEPKVSLWEKLS